MVAENEDKWSIPLLFHTKSDECEICGKSHDTEKCTFIESNVDHVKDTPTPSYARLTLPDGLEVKELLDGTCMVVATKTFLKGATFGPFIAKTSVLMDVRIEFPLRVFLSDKESVYLESYEELFCNWMCLVRPASNFEEQNLICYQLKTSIYFCTVQEIEKGQELRVWYAPYYAERMGVSLFAKPPELVHSSDEEFQEIVASLQSGMQVQDHTYSPKSKKRRKLPRKPVLGENYYRAVPPNDMLPGELLGARSRRDVWQCKECGQLETNVAAYARHLMGHFRVPARKTYYCPFCPRWFRKDGYNRRVHIDSCKVLHDKNEAKNFSVDVQNKPEKALVVKTSTGSEKMELKITSGPFEDTSGKRLIFSEDISSKDVEDNTLCNGANNITTYYTTLDGSVTSPIVINAEIRVAESNISSERGSNSDVGSHLQVTLGNSEIVQKGLLCDNVNNEKYGWNTVHPESKKKHEESLIPPFSVVGNKTNWSKNSKLFEPDRNNTGLETLAENLLPKSHLSTPILDLSDDIDFNITKSLVEMISNDCNMEKSLSFSKSNRSLDLFDGVPGPSLLISEIPGSQTTSSFYSLEKNEFIHSSFTSCDDVTDEERNRIVENLLSETDEKFLVSDYEITDGCVSEIPDSECNIENKKENEKPGSNQRTRKSESGCDFKCDICEKCFGKQLYLFRHLRKHTGEFRCNVCYMVFARKETLLTHRLMCPTEASTQQSITRLRVLCRFCKQQFHSLSALKAHMDFHYCKGNTWKCVCEKVSTDSDFIENHGCPYNSSSVSCLDCCKTFTSTEDFLDHKNQVIFRRVFRKKDFSTLCEVCGLSFKSCTGARLHRMTHGEKLFECSVCGKKFVRNDTMKEHIKLHDQSFTECPICKKRFSSTKLYKNHHRTMHTQPSYVCQYCDKSFRQKGNLTKHMKTHLPDSYISCEVCVKTFQTKKSYENHLKTHTNEVFFQCNLCDKRYPVSYQLKTHIRRTHNEMYKCAYCGMNIRYSFTLRKHLSTKHKDMVDEWDNPDAIKAMMIPVTEKEDSKQVQKKSSNNVTSYPSVKDILQTAADSVMEDESLHSDGDEEALTKKKYKTQPSIIRTPSKQIAIPEECNEETASVQLVTLSIGPVIENNDEPKLDADVSQVLTLPLAVDDNFQLAPQIVTSEPLSPQALSINLDVEPTQAHSGLVANLENTIVNYPFTLPEGYQLSLNEDQTEKLEEDSPTLVNISGIQGIDGTSAYVLSDGTILQPDLQLENNVLFYIIDTSVADSIT